MREETITCDICGERGENIREYIIAEPHVYRLGNAPMARPYRKVDAHEDCIKLVAGIIDTSWPIVLTEAAGEYTRKLGGDAS